MIKVGITGQTGFIGTHLYNTLGLYPEKYERIPFEDGFFTDDDKLRTFVLKCDVIVHLAAINRHDDQQLIYDTNVWLVKQLIDACEAANSKPHILFSSSIQEERNNPYGNSKKEGRRLFENWAKNNDSQFTGFIIPNVFGPFGMPYYNSVIATFCYQLTHNEQPEVEINGDLKLIYVGEFVQSIIREISYQKMSVRSIEVIPTVGLKVSYLLEKLSYFKTQYFDNGVIPNLDDPFERNLFNTFVCYIDHTSFFPFYLKLNKDNRGSFVETIKLHSGGQVSFSTTKPAITRGNHFHTRKAERFTVVKGRARIEIRRIGRDKVITFELDGNSPSYVDMPIWYTHNITNIGDDELFTIFWINEHFDINDTDTYYEIV